jgi:hypothetical protein
LQKEVAVEPRGGFSCTNRCTDKFIEETFTADMRVETIVEFYRYNSNVRKKYLDAIEKLPWEEVIKDRGASFGSIRNVFLHTLDAYRRWFKL